jgi:pimeloyl-ACP methyl ester carboxylesterase
MPLDHFNPDDTRTIDVTFAVLPAPVAKAQKKKSKKTVIQRKGMFVVATGGPGTSGILSADSYVANYDPSMFAAFDIVFFDQRGVGESGGLSCPNAAATYYRQDAASSPDPEAALKEFASTFAADCASEMSNPELLPYLGTDQAAEDLEMFRQIMGDEKFWLYGESYGTQYAQTYASKHGEHLAGMVLDGTVDLTLSGWDYYTQQAQAFSDTLASTLSACDGDPSCYETIISRMPFNPDDLGDEKALWVYDFIAMHLADGPINFLFPLPQGGYADRTFSLADLEFVATSQLYGEGDRMMLSRALATVATDLDIVPLARLLYLSTGLDPQTLEVIPDPSYSDAIFYGVECQDYGYPGSTPEEKAENYIRAADGLTVPRFRSLFFGDLPCAYWSEAKSDTTRPEPLLAEGIPTLVLGATTDPATPVNNGIEVYNRLADGYLITTEGGPHVTFGYGNACPDAIVTKFLVSGKMPARETVCEGIIADEFVPLAPRSATAFAKPIDAFNSVETEINYLPEIYYWDGFTPTSTACVFGGTMSISADEYGYSYTFDHCAFSRHFAMTGTGSYDSYEDLFTLKVKTEGFWQCNKATFVRYYDSTPTLSGKCTQQPVDDEPLPSALPWW